MASALTKVALKTSLCCHRVNICNYSRLLNCQLLNSTGTNHKYLCTANGNNISESNSNSSKEKSGSSSKWKWLVMGSLAGAAMVVGYATWDWYNRGKKVTDSLTMVIKRGVLAMQKREHEKANHFFHQGLEMAYEQHKKKDIDDKQLLIIQINVFGMLATVAVNSGDVVTAEKLYKETMQKCIAAGRSPDDESVIELSVKLASLYASTSRDQEAEAGFKYCVDEMDKKVEAAGGVLEADTNTLALQGLSVQSYARFLMKKKKYTEGIKLFKQSLDVAREVYGADHPQALVVLNDLASAYIINKQYKEGIQCYREAVTRGEKSPELADSLVAFHYNLGEALILTRDFEAASKECAKCMEIATKLEAPPLIEAAKRCIKDVNEEKAKHTSSKT